MKKFRTIVKALSVLMVVGLMILPVDFAFATSAGERELTDREKAAFIVRDEWTSWVNAFTASLSELDKNATSRIYDNMDFYDMQYRFTEKYKKVPEYLDEDGKPTQKLKDLIKEKRKKVSGAKVRDYLCFTSKQNASTVRYTVTGTVDTSKIGVSYDGTSFAAWDGSAITLDSGKSIYVTNKNNTLSQGTNDNFFKFELTGNIEASGSVDSMINFQAPTSTCFAKMFFGQTALKKAPEFTSTSMARYSCANMFGGCTGLTEAPELPATSLAPYCYDYMFSGCSNMTKGPSILPASKLEERCYEYMFFNCTSLVDSPIIANTTLGTGCYVYMFNGCSSLKTITINYPFANITELYNHCGNWVDGVSNTGTFYCNMPFEPTNDDYLGSKIPKDPSNHWTVVNSWVNN